MKSSLSLIAFLLLFSVGIAHAKVVRSDMETAVPAAAEKTPVLKAQYQSFFPVGNVISPRDLDGPRFRLLKKHFNILTAENAMKPLYLQRDKGVFTFDSADVLVNATLEAGMKMHGHTLAWHQQSPEWMNREGINRDEAIANLTTHAQTVADHFKGRVVSWDVLNEAIIDNPPNPADWKASLRQTPWLKAIGPDYIAMVFRAAREADPDAMLYYNDYNLDNRSKAIAVYNMVKDLNQQYPDVNGRPLIDGIGMQGHYRLNMNIDNVEASLKRFIPLGVEISITELDVQAGMGQTLSEAQTIQQGMLYARLFDLFREYSPYLGRVTMWGLDDGTSWRSPTSPTLFDKDLNPKPAFFGALNPAAFIAENEDLLADLLRKDPLQADARYGSPRLDAKDPLWQTAPEIPVKQYIMAWEGAWGTARVLWDEKYLYVLVAVTNAELNKDHRSPHEQDSVEIFIDEGNHKESYMDSDDGQYRVNFNNELSFGSPWVAEGVESATVTGSRAYTAMMKIPFKTITPKENALVGFDIQINGASARGGRQSIALWNDTSGEAWQDPSLFGVLKLIK